MTKPITITATRAVWLPSHQTPDDVLGQLERGNFSRVVDMLHIWGDLDKKQFADSTRVGEADVTIRLMPRDEQTALAVQSLNKKLDELRAAYLGKQQEILDRISKLQALDYVEA